MIQKLIIGSPWDFDMSFIIVKVSSSLNYRLIGLKIKNMQVGIKDKMKEIQLKYIEIYCVHC